MRLDGSAGRILDRGARALAAYSAEQLVSQFEGAAGQTSDTGFRFWQGFFEARINDLAAAVEAGQPRLFVSQIRWCRSGMEARGVNGEKIRAALSVLRDVIAREIGEVGQEVGRSYLADALRDCDTELPLPESGLDVADPLDRLAAEFVLSVLEGRRLDACRLIARKVDQGLSVADAYLRVLIPVVGEIGRMWHMGEVSVAEEHFASDTAQMVIAQLQGRARIAPANGRVLLAASVAGNRHDMGVRILANLFEMEGWRVVCLGGDMPGADIAAAVVDFQVDLLLLSAMLHTHLSAVERTIELVRHGCEKGDVRILVGGLAFSQTPQLASEYGADGYASSADEAIDLGRRWFSL